MFLKKNTKNSAVTILAAILFLSLASCKDDIIPPDPYEPPEPPVPECTAIEPVSVDSATTKALDDAFKDMLQISRGWLYETIVGKFERVINSQEDADNFKMFDPLPNILPPIDYEKYTLVAGLLGSAILDTVTNIELYKNDSKQRYTIDVKTIDRIDITDTKWKYFFYWRLYPKLDVNFAVNYGVCGNDDYIDLSAYNCPCEEEKPMKEMQSFPLGKTYLFKDSVPMEMRSQLPFHRWEGRYWIILNPPPVYGAGYPVLVCQGASGYYYYDICNFPVDVVKTWDIPENGCKVYFEGVEYWPCIRKVWLGSEGCSDYVLTRFERR